jgi:hypothetical protein
MPRVGVVFGASGACVAMGLLFHAPFCGTEDWKGFATGAAGGHLKWNDARRTETKRGGGCQGEA